MKHRLQKLFLVVVTIALLGNTNIGYAGEKETLPTNVCEAFLIMLESATNDDTEVDNVADLGLFVTTSILTNKDPEGALSEAIQSKNFLDAFTNFEQCMDFVKFGNTNCLKILLKKSAAFRSIFKEYTEEMLNGTYYTGTLEDFERKYLYIAKHLTSNKNNMTPREYAIENIFLQNAKANVVFLRSYLEKKYPKKKDFSRP